MRRLLAARGGVLFRACAARVGEERPGQPASCLFSGEARDTLFLNVELCARLNLRYRLGDPTCPSLNVLLPVYRLSSPAVNAGHCRNRRPAWMIMAKVCFTFTNLRAYSNNSQGERMHLCCPGEVKSHYRRVVCSFLRPERPVKYRKGEGEWRGVGSQPGWIKQHLASGGTVERCGSRCSNSIASSASLSWQPSFTLCFRPTGCSRTALDIGRCSPVGTGREPWPFTLHSRNVGYGMRTQPSNGRAIEALRSQRRPRSNYCRVGLTGALNCNQWNGT